MGDKLSKTIGKYLFYIILMAISIMMLYPFIWAITASFKTTGQLYNESPLNLVPDPLFFGNYIRAWKVLPFPNFILNSLFLATVVPSLMIVLASLAGYAFAKLKFKGRDLIFMALLGTMMIPGHVTLIPNYVLMRNLHWINNYAALVIPPLFGAANVFNIFFLRQFFLSIPKEIEEAAIIDGCSVFKAFIRVVLPNTKPALATVAILGFNKEWNVFLWPLIVINNQKKMPIQVGLAYYKDIASNWPEVFAGVTIAVIPILAVFLIFQKYFVKSMVHTGFGGQ